MESDSGVMALLWAVLPWLLIAAFWVLMLGVVRRRRRPWPAEISTDGVKMLGSNSRVIPWSDVALVVEKNDRFLIKLNSGFRLAVDKEDWQEGELERGRIRAAIGLRARLKG